jgi:hypothetical protein
MTASCTIRCIVNIATMFIATVRFAYNRIPEGPKYFSVSVSYRFPLHIYLLLDKIKGAAQYYGIYASWPLVGKLGECNMLIHNYYSDEEHLSYLPST